MKLLQSLPRGTVIVALDIVCWIVLALVALAVASFAQSLSG